MNDREETDSRLIIRMAVILLLVLAYGGVGLYVRLVYRTGIVYTHFAYIPIVLSGLWWGRKSVLIAILLVVITFSLRLFSGVEESLWNDVSRGLFFLVVTTCIGLLSEQVMKGQSALRSSEEKYRSLIDKSIAGIIVHRDNEIFFVNPRLCELLGYEPEELTGAAIGRLLYDDDRKRCCRLMSGKKDAEDQDLHYECRFVKKDGAVIWGDVTSSMTVFEGIPAVLVNVYDITDRKEAEARKQELLDLSRRQEEQLVHSSRLAELGEMAASIAHEINQPLTGIKNFAKNATFMMEKDAGNAEEVKNNLRLISEQVDRASRIINQMRSLTRKTEPQLASLDINGIIRESVEFLSPQLKLDDIKVTMELSEDIPKIMGDKIRLEQVLLNVMTNSRQAMEDAAEKKLGIRTYRDAGGNFPVVVEISDTGKGFAADEAEKIFTPFYSTKKIGDGTGLGLSISLTIIKEHGGEIEAIGAPGVGAVFKIMLPARAKAETRGS